jgi:hypothetical protein
MAKHKSQQALFDLLRKDLPPGQAPTAPVIRRTAATAPAAAAPPRPAERPRPEPLVRSALAPSAAAHAPLLVRQVSVPVLHLLLAVIAVACLVAIAFVVGTRYGPERLPATEKRPTFGETQTGGITPGLVAPSPAQPAAPAGVGPQHPSGKAPRPAPAPLPPAKPGPAPKPGSAPKPAPVERPGGTAVGPGRPVVTETPAPAGPQYRVRIARLAVSQPDAIDKMRAFLSQKGIETELDTRGGFYILYSSDRFPDKKKSDELAAQINKQLEAFEKSTRIPTSRDAYSIQITKE